MDKHQPALEVFRVSETVDLALEHFDFVVEPFQGSRGNAVAEGGEKAPAVALQALGQAPEGRKGGKQERGPTPLRKDVSTPPIARQLASKDRAT